MTLKEKARELNPRLLRIATSQKISLAVFKQTDSPKILVLTNEETGNLTLEIATRLSPLLNKQRMYTGKNGISPVDIAEHIVDKINLAVQL